MLYSSCIWEVQAKSPNNFVSAVYWDFWLFWTTIFLVVFKRGTHCIHTASFQKLCISVFYQNNFQLCHKILVSSRFKRYCSLICPTTQESYFSQLLLMAFVGSRQYIPGVPDDFHHSRHAYCFLQLVKGEVTFVIYIIMRNESCVWFDKFCS